MTTTLPDGQVLDLEENRRRLFAGELYYAYTPDLLPERREGAAATLRFNSAVNPTRREVIEMWQAIQRDKSPLPPKLDNPEEDEAQLVDYPWIEPPVRLDYGLNVKLGKNVYINVNATLLDTNIITIGDRTLIGPNCCFYTSSHPLDYRIRNGTKGPESSKPITIGEDCWFGGSVIVLPGVTVGKGAVVGAGSVVTKDVAPGVVVAGNPARVIRTIDMS